MGVLVNCLYNKKRLVPSGLFLLLLAVCLLGYFVPIPNQIEAYDPPSAAGPMVASVFVLAFGMFPLSLTILYAFKILIRKRVVLHFGFLEMRYPVSIIILMISAVWLSFGFGLALAGSSDSKFKLFAAWLICGIFIFGGFCGFIMLAVDCMAYLRRREGS